VLFQKIGDGACGLVSQPARAALCNLHVQILIQQKDYPAADRWANESLRVLECQSAAHYYLTIINDHLERYDEALLHLNAMVDHGKKGRSSEAEDDVSPAPQDVCYKRASIYRAMKKPLDERRELESALRIDPLMTPALHELAALSAREQNFIQALSLITKALHTDPANGSILHLRSQIMHQMQRSDEALSDAASAFQCGEKGHPFLLFWIRLAKEIGKDAGALPAYALLLERQPEAVDVLLPYIQLLVRQEHVSTALTLIDRSLPYVKDEAMRQVLRTIQGKLANARCV
jgi:tetratricopeptide (TPR) repeat protein